AGVSVSAVEGERDLHGGRCASGLGNGRGRRDKMDVRLTDNQPGQEAGQVHRETLQVDAGSKAAWVARGSIEYGRAGHGRQQRAAVGGADKGLNPRRAFAGAEIDGVIGKTEGIELQSSHVHAVGDDGPWLGAIA